jgi:hypothetical protein
LAPTTELRQLQYREDDRRGVGKRNRVALAPENTERYNREIVDPFDLGALVAELPGDSATALLCVERDPQACHRSLVAERLRTAHGLPVTDLRPGAISAAQRESVYGCSVPSSCRSSAFGRHTSLEVQETR